MTPFVAEELKHLREALMRDCVNSFDSLLDPYSHPVLKLGPCQLFPSDECRAYRVRNHEVYCYFKALFENAAYISGSRLSRYDLHHAHLFFNPTQNLLGMLFHAKEYPAYDVESFPFELGFCQRESDLCLADESEMECRSILWMCGEEHMALLDGPSRWPFGTIYESEFGHSIADIYFFASCFSGKEECLNRGLHIVVYKQS